jgi:hypothetical protein
MLKIILPAFAFFAIISCSDPAEEIQAKKLETKADSLRAEIRATQIRIDSLQKEAAQHKKVADSLGIPNPKP